MPELILEIVYLLKFNPYKPWYQSESRSSCFLKQGQAILNVYYNEFNKLHIPHPPLGLLPLE